MKSNLCIGLILLHGLCFCLMEALCIHLTTNRESMRRSLLGKNCPTYEEMVLLRSLRSNLRWLPKLWLTRRLPRCWRQDPMEWSSEEWLFINRSQSRWWQMMGSLVRTVSENPQSDLRLKKNRHLHITVGLKLFLIYPRPWNGIRGLIMWC